LANSGEVFDHHVMQFDAKIRHARPDSAQGYVGFLPAYEFLNEAPGGVEASAVQCSDEATIDVGCLRWTGRIGHAIPARMDFF
jgi:hypothetical protein